MKLEFRHIYIILIALFANSLSVVSQNEIDSLLLKKFPAIIGNIGFATDSTHIVAGDIPRGEITTFNFELYNFGSEPVIFTNGKSNRFLSQIFEPVVLAPNMTGTMIVELDADFELELGEFGAEISIISNDKKNPYKFLNLLLNVVEGVGGANSQIYDTVPHIVFDHYNYDYGHQTRGRVQYHTFLITNNGSEPLIITKVIVPSGITVEDRPLDQLLSGEQSILRLKINTRGRVGVQHQSVLVHSNDPANPLVILGLHGSVRVYPSHKKTSVQCNPQQQRF
ncbi:MAG: DUF1573 domain-containing protein [Bacteroidetes bacterium]|nr:DUF1573 domain-containing protein [Bacteroidota bacterium]